MVKTEPRVHLIAIPHLKWDGLYDFLSGQESSEWADTAMCNPAIRAPELLCEVMGRICYKSWRPGLNPNVTKVRSDSKEYLENILKSGHGSVLEHAQFSFIFENVSRVFTHELVRHRAGTAISQESLRYVRLSDIGFRVPPILADMESEVVSIVEKLEEFQKNAAEKFGLDKEGTPFHYKKEVTSALRRLAPLGLSTNLGWSANIRTLRYVIEKRTEKGAEEEIRLVFRRVAEIMRRECPILFADMVTNDEGEVTTKWSKV